MPSIHDIMIGVSELTEWKTIALPVALHEFSMYCLQVKYFHSTLKSKY